MKNFWTLFRYELKKLWKRPMTWIAVLVFSAGFVTITVQPLFRSGGATFTAADAGGSEISQFLTAGEQYRLRVEGARALSGQPMDEAFFQTAQETIPLERERHGRHGHLGGRDDRGHDAGSDADGVVGIHARQPGRRAGAEQPSGDAPVRCAA